MQKINSSRGIKLAMLGAALTMSAAAYAADGDGPRRGHDRSGHHAAHHHGHHGFHKAHPHAFHHHGKAMHGSRHADLRRAGLIVPGYGVVSRDFVQGMGLNENQQKLLEEARKAAQDLRNNRKDRIKEARKGQLERFASVDPEQALKQADERREKMLAERRQIDEKWIAVWKSLDDSQQARVADNLKQRAEKAQKRAEKFQERRQSREAAKAERAGSKAQPAHASS